VARSAISDKEVEPGTEAPVIVAFQDGQRREAWISADEAKAIRANGRNISRAWIHVLGRLLRPGTWLLVALASAVIIPAITKQWTDRPEELELKGNIVETFSTAASDTIETTRILVNNFIPEARLADHICDRDEREEEDPAACRAAREAETTEEQRVHNEVRLTWQRASVMLRAQMSARFPDSDLPEKANSFVRATRQYLALESDLCGQRRDNLTAALLDYLDEDRETKNWPDLFGLTPNQCVDKSQPMDFSEAFAELGELLQDRRQQLTTAILSAKAKGFSTTWPDYFRDAWPALLIALFLLILWTATVKEYRRM
jgi:hypothetical protein